MADEATLIPVETPEIVGVGLLGATVDARFGLNNARDERLTMIERRIIRIEMAMRQGGIEVERIPLPTP